MELNEAKKLAFYLMEKHNAEADFKWFNEKKTLGKCILRRDVFTHKVVEKTILLSKNFVLANQKEEVEQTILHEIAHLLAGFGHGHDRVWKDIAKYIGYNFDDRTIIFEGAKYEVICNKCKNRIAVYYREPKIDFNKCFCKLCKARLKNEDLKKYEKRLFNNN